MDSSWVFFTLLGVGFYVLIAAVVSSRLHTDESFSDHAINGFIGMLWPVWVGLAILASPFVAVGWLGRRLFPEGGSW